MDDFIDRLKKEEKKKKIVIVDLNNQKPAEPPRIVSWYNINTKEFTNPFYPYGLDKEWEFES